MPGDGLTHGPPADKKAGGSHHRFSRIIRHSLRDGVTAYTRSPRRPGFLAPVIALTSSARLSLSVGRPGPRDFAVHDAGVRLTPCRGHRIPASRILTIAIRPSSIEAGYADHTADLQKFANLLFLSEGLDKDFARAGDLPDSQSQSASHSAMPDCCDCARSFRDA
jgi:hypothetical protein